MNSEQQTRNSDSTTRARRSLEDAFEHIEERLQPPSALELARQAAIKAAVYAPIAFGVGYGLLRLAARRAVPGVQV